MIGSERCPLEAALFGSIVITNKCLTGGSFTDVPIPSKFLLEEYSSMVIADPKKATDHFSNIFKDIFQNYWSLINQFDPLRKEILSHSPNSMTRECKEFLQNYYSTLKF